jgi:hypothetical protein
MMMGFLMIRSSHEDAAVRIKQNETNKGFFRGRRFG